MLETRDLDSLDDIDGKLKSSDKIVLSELCTDQDKIELVKRLKGDDQMAVILGKISFYCEIVKSTISFTKQLLLKSD